MSEWYRHTDEPRTCTNDHQHYHITSITVNRSFDVVAKDDRQLRYIKQFTYLLNFLLVHHLHIKRFSKALSSVVATRRGVVAEGPLAS